MLPLMLMLVADPLTPPPAPPAPPSVRIIDAEGVMRSVNQTVDAAQGQCRNGEFQQARTAPVIVQGEYRGQPFTVTTRAPAPVLNDLMFRQGDPVKRMTRDFADQSGGALDPALKRTRWIVRRRLTGAEIGSDRLPESIAAFAADARPLLEFGWKALGAGAAE